MTEMSTIILPNYKIHEKIGEGGFGTVYRGEQNSTGQIVAIKVLKFDGSVDELKRKNQIARFDRETQICVEINHPNIVKLLDKGYTDNGELYAIFEFVEGVTLKDFILEYNGISAPLCAELMGQVLDALVSAHKKGIVHRDLKPQNIMITKTGSKYHAKILDFGIGAFTLEVRNKDYQSLSITRSPLGTPAYSAPEQLRGEPPTVKSDLYSWGLVLVECLTGQPAIYGATIGDIFHEQLSASQVPMPPAISGHPLADLLRRVLQKNQKKRVEDAEKLFQEFSQINFNTIVGKLTHPSIESTVEARTSENDFAIYSSPKTEKRQITVLCFQLSVLSNSIIEEVDNEVLETLQKDQLNQASDIVIRYGGYMVGNLANMAIAYFGFPTVSDNDSRRAGRAALELIGQVQKRNRLLKSRNTVSADIKVAMHTGNVLISEGQTPSGLIPNLCFELCHLAPSGCIMVTDTTKKLLDPYHEFEPVEARLKKVPTGSLKTYLLSGERQTEAFSFLRPWSANREMVGRIKEKNLVIEQWRKVNKDSGGAVLIKGQAGIGKSKLVYECKKQVREDKKAVKECRCLPEHRNDALHPFLEMLKKNYQWVDKGHAEISRSKIESTVRFVTDEPDKYLPILYSWLGVLMKEETITLSREEQKILLLDILEKLISQLGDSKPFLLVLEDLHWIDPTSLEFLDRLLSRIDDKKFLLLITTRPRYKKSLQVNLLTPLELTPLKPDQVADMVKGILGVDKVSEQAIAFMNRKGDGIPLYIEELTHMLMDDHLFVENDGEMTLKAELDESILPVTIKDLLSTRLNRLAGAQETAQTAAAIGREFSYELLINSSSRDEALVQGDLENLMNADLVYRQRRVYDEVYIFRHALIRDAAYESMTHSIRKGIHCQIARSLESLTSTQQFQPGLIGTHWASAEEYQKAVHYGTMSANSSLKRSVASECIAQAEETLGWVDKLEEEAQVDAKVEIYEILTTAHMETKGWASDEVAQYSEASLQLLKQYNRQDEIDKLVPQHWWKVIGGVVGGKRNTIPLLELQLWGLFETVNDLNRAAITCCLGFYYFTEGDCRKAKATLEQSIAIYGDKQNPDGQKSFGFDVKVFAMATLARAYDDLEMDELALSMASDAVSLAKKLEHIPSIGIALMYYGVVHQHYGNKKEVLISSQELIDVSEKYNLPIYLGFAVMLNDWARGMTEGSEKVLQDLKKAGSLHGIGHFQSFYAETFANRGEYQKAIDKVTECIALDEAIQERNAIPYLYLKRAQYRLQNDPEDYKNRAREDVERAKSIAINQNTRAVLSRIKLLTRSSDVMLQ